MGPNESNKLSDAVEEIANDIPLIARLLAAYQSGGKAEALKLLPAAVDTVQADLVAVGEALPTIKAGYKTTEFWLVVLALALVAGLTAAGKPVNVEAASLIGALTAIYSIVRGLVKKG